jgi:hypothetical protein
MKKTKFCWKIGKISIKNEKLTRFVEKALMWQFFCWDFIRKLIWLLYFWVSFSKCLGNSASSGKTLENNKMKKSDSWISTHKKSSWGEAEKRADWLIDRI